MNSGSVVLELFVDSVAAFVVADVVADDEVHGGLFGVGFEVDLVWVLEVVFEGGCLAVDFFDVALFEDVAVFAVAF